MVSTVMTRKPDPKRADWQAREAELKRQHEEFMRANWEKHNHRPQKLTMDRIRVRVRRRQTNRRLGEWAREWR